MKECNFPSVHIDNGMGLEERIFKEKAFHKFEFRILITSNLNGHDIDISGVDIAVNYDFPAVSKASLFDFRKVEWGYYLCDSHYEDKEGESYITSLTYVRLSVLVCVS